MALTQSTIERLGQRLIQVAELATAYHMALTGDEGRDTPADQAAGLRAAVKALGRSPSADATFTVNPAWR